MDLNSSESKKKKDFCKYFKCSKPGYIYRFYKSRATEVLNLKKDSENSKLLPSEKSQKKEL